MRSHLIAPAKQFTLSRAGDRSKMAAPPLVSAVAVDAASDLYGYGFHY